MLALLLGTTFLSGNNTTPFWRDRFEGIPYKNRKENWNVKSIDLIRNNLKNNIKNQEWLNC